MKLALEADLPLGLNVDLKMDLKWAMDIERNRSLVLGNGSQPCLASASSRDGKYAATLAYFATGGGTYTSYDAFATSASGSYYLTAYLATFAKGTTATGTCSGSGSRS